MSNTNFLYVMLKKDGPIEYRSMLEVVLVGVDMHLALKEKIAVSAPEYQGIIKNTGRSFTLGTIYGTEYVAEIDSPRGHTTLNFLVNEEISVN